MEKTKRNEIILEALYNLIDDVHDWPDEFAFTYEEVKALVDEYETIPMESLEPHSQE